MVTGKVKLNGGNLNLRKIPKGDIVGLLPNGAQVDILDTQTFHKVRLDGNVGYVPAGYISLNDPTLRLPPGRIEETPSIRGTPPVLSPLFDLMQYEHGRLIGEKCFVDADFVPHLTRICNYARVCEVEIYVTHSLREINKPVEGAIVKPASKSTHLVGHGIDMNVMYEGKLYNSGALCLSALPDAPAAVQQFINLIDQDDVLRWGGDFNDEDPVHIDDDFYHQHTELWEAKLVHRIGQIEAEIA